MKILVTGGLGFIGHNVVAKFEELGHEVIIVDSFTDYLMLPRTELQSLFTERQTKIKTKHISGCDISDQFGMEYTFKNHYPDVVVHLASFPRQKVVNKNPQLGSRSMIEGLLNTLECCKKFDVKKFVYISSSMVYGDFTDNVLETAICNPQGQYGIMKLAGEWLVNDYRKFFDCAIVRPSAVYGPLDVTDRVVSKFFQDAMLGKPLQVNGGSERLDFTFVEDAASGIVLATLKGNNKIYNITRSRSRSLTEAAQIVINVVGTGSVEVKDRDMSFPSRGALNIDLARKELGYDPKIEIEDGFERYYKWLSR